MKVICFSGIDETFVTMKIQKLRPTKNTILFYNEELDIIMFTNVYVNNKKSVTAFFDKSYQIESKEILRIDI